MLIQAENMIETAMQILVGLSACQPLIENQIETHPAEKGDLWGEGARLRQPYYRAKKWLTAGDDDELKTNEQSHEFCHYKDMNSFEVDDRDNLTAIFEIFGEEFKGIWIQFTLRGMKGKVFSSTKGSELVQTTSTDQITWENKPTREEECVVLLPGERRSPGLKEWRYNVKVCTAEHQTLCEEEMTSEDTFRYHQTERQKWDVIGELVGRVEYRLNEELELCKRLWIGATSNPEEEAKTLGLDYDSTNAEEAVEDLEKAIRTNQDSEAVALLTHRTVETVEMIVSHLEALRFEPNVFLYEEYYEYPRWEYVVMEDQRYIAFKKEEPRGSGGEIEPEETAAFDIYEPMSAFDLFSITVALLGASIFSIVKLIRHCKKTDRRQAATTARVNVVRARSATREVAPEDMHPANVFPRTRTQSE